MLIYSSFVLFCCSDKYAFGFFCFGSATDQMVPADDRLERAAAVRLLAGRVVRVVGALLARAAAVVDGRAGPALDQVRNR